MIRTQIQLTQTQSEQLKQLAARRGVSVAQLIRDGVDRLLSQEAVVSPDLQKAQAMDLIGCGASGVGDLSEKHDDHLADAFGN